jgi:2-dehydropantoate 2-reductase
MTDQAYPPLRVLSIGAGAIGTYIGGSLALHRQRVVFLEQPAIAAELRQRGLSLKLGEQEHHIPDPLIAASLDEALALGPFDVALFALKSYDTGPVIQTLLPYAEQLPSILCLQNGVDNEGALGVAFGEQRVIPGTVTSAVGRRAAGDIVLERKRGMGLAAAHELSPRLGAALNEAGLNARLYARPADMKWSKMLTNLLANATSAILDMTPGEIFAHPGLYRLEIAQLREALRVMAKSGIHTVDLPGTPVMALAVAARSLPLAISRPLLKRSVGSGRGGKMPSFHVDLHAGGGKSEVGYLNGAVARYGGKTGVSTPVNSLLNEILQALTDGSLPRDSYAGQADKLLAALK